MLATVKLMVAAGLVTLFGGILLIGLLATQQGDQQASFIGAPGSPDAAERAIHWHSDTVDLEADSMILRIGDETFTTEGIDVVVDAYNGEQGQWPALYPRWVEDGRTLWLYLTFDSDGETWGVDGPWLWLDGLIGLDGHVDGDSVDFERSGWIRMPLGEPYEGDWRLEGRLDVPTCDPQTPHQVKVDLTFEDLRLAVRAPNSSPLDGFLYQLFHRGSFLGDLVHGSLKHPEPRLLECAPASSDPEAAASSAP